MYPFGQTLNWLKMRPVMCFSHLNINRQFYLYIYFMIINQGLKSVCNPEQYEKP